VASGGGFQYTTGGEGSAGFFGKQEKKLDNLPQDRKNTLDNLLRNH